MNEEQYEKILTVKNLTSGITISDKKKSKFSYFYLKKLNIILDFHLRKMRINFNKKIWINTNEKSWRISVLQLIEIFHLIGC